MYYKYEVKKTLSQLFFIPILAIFLFFSLSLLTENPLIWSDEAVYADIAKNILRENRLGTDLLKGMIPGFENHAYWSPPLFMYVLAGWFKIADFSIISQRLLSVTLGTTTLALFLSISLKITQINTQKSAIAVIITGLLLSLDFLFLKASRISRPEILVLTLIAFSLLCFLKFIREKHHQRLWLIGSALLLGLALVTHMTALAFPMAFFVYFIITSPKNKSGIKNILLFALAVSIPTLIRLISIFPNYEYLINQLNVTANSRAFLPPFHIFIWQLPWLMKINHFIYIIMSLWFLFFTFKHRSELNILISLIIIFTWSFAYLGGVEWYLIYPVFFSYLAFCILLNHFLLQSSKLLFKLPLIIICLILLTFNLKLHIDYTPSHQNNYQYFTEQVRQQILPGKTVFLSSFPDAYPALVDRNKLYTFPTFTLDLKEFEKILNDTDYILMSGYYYPLPIAKFTDNYIDQNIESFSELHDPYYLVVIKLKDKHLRTSVQH